GSLQTGQQEAVLRVETTGDSFVPIAAAFEIDVNAPGFQAGVGGWGTDHEVVYEGDTVVATLLLDNGGTADAENVSLQLPVPAGLSLASFTLDGSPGDDQGAPVDAAALVAGVDVGDVAGGA